MSYVYVVQPGHTQWSRQERVEGAVGVPLCPEGAAAMEELAGEFQGRRVRCVYHGPDDAARQTGRIFAKALGVRSHTMKDLRELDFGLWEGLTLAEVQRRHGRVYKQWRDDPMTVCPPEGEMVADAADRVRSALRRIARKHAEQNLVIVAGTVAAALVRCALAGEAPGTLWNHVKAPGCWDGHELPPAARKQEQS